MEGAFPKHPKMTDMGPLKMLAAAVYGVLLTGVSDGHSAPATPALQRPAGLIFFLT